MGLSDRQIKGLKKKSPKSRKALVKAIKHANKQMQRELAVALMFPLMQEPNYHLKPLMMPLMMPQISDARINIQTFNPPPAPLVPGVLPNPHFKYDMMVPEKTLTTVVDRRWRDVNLKMDRADSREARKMIKRSLERALEKYNGVKVLRNGDPVENVRLNTFSSDTERQLGERRASQKLDKILRKLEGVADRYRGFQLEVSRKMDFLKFLTGKYGEMALQIVV